MMRALIFDCDGVLADTERHGHLPTFNQTFETFGVPLRWSPEHYGALLAIGGGKERMRRALQGLSADEWPSGPADSDGVDELIGRMHAHKTALYTARIAAGSLPPRPGVARLAADAAAAGWRLAVASTSAEESVRAVLELAVGGDLARRFAVVAGDAVPRKKPAPDVYLRALEVLGVAAPAAVAVEDTSIGLTAATGAGIATVVTVSEYSRGERFDDAALVVSDLGDTAAPEVLQDPLGLGIAEPISLTHLEAVIGRTRNTEGDNDVR